MAKKCSICKDKIETTFLGKINGTIIGKDYVCSDCQKKHQGKLKEILNK